MGVGLSLNELDDQKIERARPNLDVVSKYAVGLGADGIVGVEFTIGSHFVLPSEGKVCMEYFYTAKKSGLRIRNRLYGREPRWVICPRWYSVSVLICEWSFPVLSN